MASSRKQGRPLVIVESPAKARTIGRFLGSDYQIEASIGHVRDLPSSAAEIPAAVKKEKWSRLGIDVEDYFKPLYVVPQDKREQIKKLKSAVTSASALYLATDEDREGESISWHLLQELKPKCKVHRLVFHEITKEAILESLEHPREIDQDLVEAQETRRLVDRLYGYSVSPLLWKKIKPKLSAGRVQSVAVRLIVERERARMAFRSAEYWSLEGRFTPDSDAGDATFEATLVQLDGRRIAVGRDFDPDTGELKPATDQKAAALLLDQDRAVTLAGSLAGAAAEVASLEQKPFTERPAPPFTTSTLQQEASRKLRFSAQRTMRAAQRLYENGFITYMRTDSTTLSDQALGAARNLIGREYGREHLPEKPRAYQTKVKNAQEAHEAIRPAGHEFQHPGRVASEVGDDERRLYELIWRRTVACQMKDARGQRTTLTLEMDAGPDGKAGFQATGKTYDYPGFRLAYVEDMEDADAELAEAERVLPRVAVGQGLDCLELKPAGHTTQPPPRLTEAGLIKELEARGIGRPSTYASIIETILAREYCFKKGTALVPTFTAFAVIDLLADHLGWLVDYQFSARMEDDLDEISNGRKKRLDYLTGFWLGNGAPGLRDELEQVEDKIDAREVCTIPLGKNPEGEQIDVRVGRYGPFLSCGERRASLPDDIAPDELSLKMALDLLQKSSEGPRQLGTDPDSGKPVYVRVGRFGPYFQLGESEDGNKPKMASLLAGMEPETVTLEQALAVLALPRVVGVARHASGKDAEILASNGRYGPYLKWGTDTRSIPAGDSPLTVTMETALRLFAEPKQHGRGRRTQKALKELGKHPASGATVKLLEGRYGPYVSDGATNASLPRGESPDGLTLERAVDLLAERAARGGDKPKKRGRRKSGMASKSG
jgi:DNA topoisomerase-1